MVTDLNEFEMEEDRVRRGIGDITGRCCVGFVPDRCRLSNTGVELFDSGVLRNCAADIEGRSRLGVRALL